MVSAVRIHTTGGPEVLRYETVDLAPLKEGEVRIRQRAIGVNFIDIYQRIGLYKMASFPAILGMEGAGDVVMVGSGVTSLRVGDRVAYGTEVGGYAEERTISAERLVLLPQTLSYDTAAAIMLRGMTVRYLFCETYKVVPSTKLLFHAAAGGVGLLACQWARAIGATVIGTVGSSEKAKLALKNGCTHVIEYRRENFVDRVKEITDGQGCDVVYDSIGRETFYRSLDCLKPKGLMVSFGNASGPVPPFELTALKGSLFITRPSLLEYTKTRENLVKNAADVFQMLLEGKIKNTIHNSYSLSEASQAHRDLEERKTAGSILLHP